MEPIEKVGATLRATGSTVAIAILATAGVPQQVDSTATSAVVGLSLDPSVVEITTNTSATTIELAEQFVTETRGAWNSEVVVDAEDMRRFLAELERRGPPPAGLVELFAEFDHDD